MDQGNLVVIILTISHLSPAVRIKIKLKITTATQLFKKK